MSAATKNQKNYPTKATPTHVAIILDGNRRWARQQGLAIAQGHRKVALESIRDLAKHCIKLGIPYLTVWAFSTQNWEREVKEVKLIMDIFRELVKEEIDQLHQEGVKINTIGDLSRFDADIQQAVADGIAQTKDNQKLTLTLALNYGGRDELARAMQHIIDAKIKQVTEEIISQYLDTADLPNPDLVIRPGGEKRLSGFLSWQIEYAELYFTDVLMPDFGPAELDQALADFAKRQRRFGR